MRLQMRARALCTSVSSQPVMDETTQEMTEASDVNEAYYRCLCISPESSELTVTAKRQS